MFGELAESVRAQLVAMLRVVEGGDDVAVAAVARSDMPGVLAALNGLLADHRPDVNGYCSGCGSGHWWRRRRNVPCRQYLAVHLAMIGDGERSHARHALH